MDVQIKKASAAYGSLYHQIWKQLEICLQTKIKVHHTIQITLVSGCEVWTCYQRHIKKLESSHLWHLRWLLGIMWQDWCPTQVLVKAGLVSIIWFVPSWDGLVTWFICLIPVYWNILYSELSSGNNKHGWQTQCFKILWTSICTRQMFDSILSN